MDDLNQNEVYLFFEVNLRNCQYTILMDFVAESREVSASAMRGFAKVIHKDAVPLIFDGGTYLTMEGIFVKPKKGKVVKVPGWRERKGWDKGSLVPWLATTIGKAIFNGMGKMTVKGHTDDLKNLVEKDFGKQATNRGFSHGYVQNWGYGSYSGEGGDENFPVRVLRILRRPSVEKKKTPHGLKKIKWSRVVEIREISDHLNKKKKKK